ncbi:hypothetical protein SFR_5470 [Streptomyces sp. FR-008]|nr:hypothetical protein SFR_5470 [Streptomyces sp. FR-008]
MLQWLHGRLPVHHHGAMRPRTVLAVPSAPRLRPGVLPRVTAQAL